MWTEIRAGMVTFVTMAYIIMVNPAILGESGSRHNPMPFQDVATATTLSSVVASLSVGLLANLPFGMAPGMGLNSYFTYGVCLHLGLTWQVALAAVFIQGILFMILSLTGMCSLIQDFAPPCIKKSITVGLGLFQALIGFECIRLVIRGNNVLLGLGDLSRPDVWLALAGIILIVILLVLEVKAAMLLGIVFVTLVAWGTGLASAPDALWEMPSLANTFGQMDFRGYVKEIKHTLPVTLVFLFVSIFDTAGVQFAAGTQAGILDRNGKLPKSREAFFSAGLATCVGAIFGTSPVIIHNETCAGIQDGGRTGLTAVTVAVCFLVSLPFNPIFKAVPVAATAPPLVVVGMFMMAHARFIDWENLEEGLPGFIVVTMLPFTYSIANGMLFGLGTYAVVKSITLFVQWAGGAENMRELVREKLKDPIPGSPVSPYISHGARLSLVHNPPRDRASTEYSLDSEDSVDDHRHSPDHLVAIKLRRENFPRKGKDDVAAASASLLHADRNGVRQGQQSYGALSTSPPLL